MKFLIIRFSSIGDVVLTTPVIRCLKQQVPDAEIHYLTKSKFYPIVRSNPHVDKVHQFSNNLHDNVKELRKEKYDHIIDLQHSLRSNYVTMRVRANTHRFRKLNILKWLRINWKMDILPNLHVVDRYLETLKPFGVTNDGKGLDFYIRDKDHVDIQSLPADFHNGYIAFVIGGTYFTKRLPVSKMISIIRKLELPVILIGDETDKAIGYEIEKNTRHKIFNACGSFNIGQSASVLQQSVRVISHDTGMMHIAAAMKKEIISVWGNTIPEFGMSPYYGDAKVRHFEAGIKLKCRPCSKLGYSKCPKGHFKCMEQQSTTKIAEWVNKN